MTEPRTRTAAEVADHAGVAQADAQHIEDRSWDPTTRALARCVTRLAAQVEDLAAVVDERLGWHEPARHSAAWLRAQAEPVSPAPFPPVEWPLKFQCSVFEQDTLVVSNGAKAGVHILAVDGDDEQCRASVVLTPNDARHLAHAILARLDGEQ